jgi:response regulator of citrate/malate metabolism
MNSSPYILLVESNPEEAAIVQDALQQSHPLQKIQWVKNSEEVIHSIFGKENRSEATLPRLIILNLNTGEGIDLVRRIKENAHTCNIVIISVLPIPHEIEIFSDAISAGTDICLIRTTDFKKFIQDLKQELGFYWQVLE